MKDPKRCGRCNGPNPAYEIVPNPKYTPGSKAQAPLRALGLTEGGNPVYCFECLQPVLTESCADYHRNRFVDGR